MSDLPAGWSTAKLGELAEVNPPKDQIDVPADKPMAFVPMASVKEEFGGIDVSAARPFEQVKKGYVQFRERDVLFAKITPCMENGKVGVVPRLESSVGYGSTEFHIVRAPEALDPRWVAHFLSREEFRRVARRNMSGSAGQLRVPDAWLSEQSIPVAPSREQRRIVEKLEELVTDLDAGVAALERARANLKCYRAAVLKAAVEGRLTEKWRAAHPDVEPASKLLERILAERRRKWEEAQIKKYADKGESPPKGWKEKYPEPVKPDMAGPANLPKGWCWVTVDQVSHSIRYGTSAKTREFDSGVPVVRMGNIQDGGLDWSSQKFLPATHDEFPDLFLEAGDVLFNRTNSLELVGKTAVYKGVPSPCSYASYLIGVRPVAGWISQTLAFFLNSTVGRAWIASVASQQVGQANVNGSKLAALTFPLAPALEQAELVKAVEQQVSSLEQAAKDSEALLMRASTLRQAILKRAFEGKLVPQDPRDEPASELLARIRAGRGMGAAKEKRRGGRRAA